MALCNLIACLASGWTDAPCIILHSPRRDVALRGAKAVLAAIDPSSTPHAERHVLSATDPGRHTTSFEYERGTSSLLVDLSQGDVACDAAVKWLASIAPRSHVLGAGRRRCIVVHCADLLSWADQNAMKKVIEGAQRYTLFVLTASGVTSLQDAILSRGVVVRCPIDHATGAAAAADVGVDAYVQEALRAAATATVASAGARDSALSLSKLLDVGFGRAKLLHGVLGSLLCGATSDRERNEVVRDMAEADAHTGACAAVHVQLTTAAALRKPLFLACARRRVKKPA